MSAIRRLGDPYVAGVALGVGLVVSGLGSVYLAWRGAAGTLVVPFQLAWVISGGLGALCMVGVGLAVVLIQTDRRHEAERRHRVDHVLADAVHALAAARAGLEGSTRALSARESDE